MLDAGKHLLLCRQECMMTSSLLIMMLSYTLGRHYTLMPTGMTLKCTC